MTLCVYPEDLPVISVSNPHSMGSWIRIRIANADPDPEKGKSAKIRTLRRKVKSVDQKKIRYQK
jgi:hypothetical protein